MGLRKQRCGGRRGERGWEDELGGNKLHSVGGTHEPQGTLAGPHSGKDLRLHPLPALAPAHAA